MLVELKLVEQRYRAVIDVLDGMSVTDLARRNGVSRQKRPHVASPLRQRRHGRPGRQELEARGLSDQMSPVIEARVVELRRAHPRWGPRSIRTELAKEGFSPPLLDALRSIAPWCAIICSSRRRGQPITSGLQTLGARPLHGALADGCRPGASILLMAPRSRWSPASTTFYASASVPGGGPSDGETGQVGERDTKNGLDTCQANGDK